MKGIKKAHVIVGIIFSVITIQYLWGINYKNDSIDYIIELNKFNINNNNLNAKETTEGINKALEYAKSKGYKTVELPEGHYSIDTSVISPIVLSDGKEKWTHNRKGIVMQSDMELIMTNAILEMVPTSDPYYSIFTISDCKNSKVTGGTILGDRNNHDYGQRINNNGDELESGSLDENTGLPIEDDTKVRTKDFIYSFNDEALPEKFVLSVLENTSKNTVDGGVRYIYCYDKNEKYLGIAKGGNGFLSKAELLPNTQKIKVSFKDEKRLDAKYYITTELVYSTHEFGTGITVTASKNIEINNVTVKDTIGDCIGTSAPPLKVKVDDLRIIDCTLENARRQGLSLVATGENYIIKGCNIGKINGVDPQSGIDIEHYDYVKDVIIEESNFYDNKKWDIINYNGSYITVRNNNFTGGIASTFGWNMIIEDNNFEYKDSINNPKIHPEVALALGTNKSDKDKAYFKINNNIIKNYKKAGSMSELKMSEFKKNKIIDTEELVIRGDAENNIFENSKIRYSTPVVSNEKFIDCIVGIDNDKCSTNFKSCEFNESQFMPRGDTTMSNCRIINKEKSFGETSAWWNLERKVIFESCDIITEYKNNTEFLANYQAITTFKNCNLNIAAGLFSLNYGTIKFEGCDIKFNDYFDSNEMISFDEVVYGNETNYWEFNNCEFDSQKSIIINTDNILNCKFKGEVIRR